MYGGLNGLVMARRDMVSRAFRCQVRLSLSDLDHDVYADKTIILAQQPDEPDEHILLRFLAWVFFFDDMLADASGWTILSEPDLIACDLLGDVRLWIECGLPSTKHLVRAMGRLKSARFIALFGDRAEAEGFSTTIAAARPRNPENLEVHVVSRPLMARLEAIAGRSMKWSATLSDGLLYLDCDGEVIEGELTRLGSRR